MNEALAQDYDGLLRIAPAWPSGWDATARCRCRTTARSTCRWRAAPPVTVVLEAGGNATMQVRSPWSGQSVQVIDANTGAHRRLPHHRRPVRRPGRQRAQLPDREVRRAVHVAALRAGHRQRAEHRPAPGPVQIGLDPVKTASSLAATFNNVGVTADNNTAPGNLDGGGASMSATALANAARTRAAPSATPV